MRRVFPTVLVAALSLAGSLVATFFLYRAAESALDRVLEERLRAAGESAALLIGALSPKSVDLRAVANVNGLDGAYLLDPSLAILADASGPAGRRADLLRVDADRVRRAFEGDSSVGPGYSLGDLLVTTGYFPVRRQDGSVAAVLGFEAGRSFALVRQELARARSAAVALALIGALALAFVAARWTALERMRRQQAEQAARGEAIARMGAMVAHEIRNPLSVIRALVDTVREPPASAPERQRALLEEILVEVDRLRRLTEDFLFLGTPERSLVRAPVDLSEVLLGAVRNVEAAFRGVRVRCDLGTLPPLSVDANRLHQVFANLLANAAQAAPDSEIELRSQLCSGWASVRIHDCGPGLTAAARERLFDAFHTTREGGTGLGLAVSRMIVHRHGGELSVVDEARPGATFEVRLPLATAEEGAAWPTSS